MKAGRTGDEDDNDRSSRWQRPNSEEGAAEFRATAVPFHRPEEVDGLQLPEFEGVAAAARVSVQFLP